MVALALHAVRAVVGAQVAGIGDLHLIRGGPGRLGAACQKSKANSKYKSKYN